MAPSMLPYSAIKELYSSGTHTSLLPPHFAIKGGNDHEAVIEDVLLPTIDFFLLTKGTPEQRSRAIQDLARACEDWGFFVLVNHGVSERLREEMMEKIEAFFDLTLEQKEEYADIEAMNPIRYGTSLSFNHKLDAVRYWRDYLMFVAHPEFHCPANPHGLRKIAQEYCECTRNLARKLLNGIWEGLGLEEKSMNDDLDLDKCFQNIISNLYPPCPQPELAMGLPSHSDHGLLTVLYQNGVDGLELKHNGKWVRIKHQPNCFIINIGDQLEIVSNGKYKSALHRAMVNGANTRISVVTFVSPSSDTFVAPSPQLVSDENPATFRGIKYGEFLKLQRSIKPQEKSALESLRL